MGKVSQFEVHYIFHVYILEYNLFLFYISQIWILYCLELKFTFDAFRIITKHWEYQKMQQIRTLNELIGSWL